MNNAYDWKTHYDLPLTMCEGDGSFHLYYFDDDKTAGKVMSCSILPGVQMIYNDLNVPHCGRHVIPSDNVVEINYCFEGRYECSVNDRYCFYVGPRDFSVGTVGRSESHGGFPTRRFRGVSLFVELETLAAESQELLGLFEIDLNAIRELATQQPRYYILHGNERIEQFFMSLSGLAHENYLPLWRVKVMELLVLLSRTEVIGLGDEPAYLSRKQVGLAKKVQALITEDLARHLTLEQISAQLSAGQTALKTAFKGVYGVSIYSYLRSFRMQQAQNLIRETNLPVADIAAAVGYSNPAKFASAFKSETGLTPKEYKNSAALDS